MKKSCLLILLLVLLIPCTALAAAPEVFFYTGESIYSSADELPSDAVSAYESKGKYYLFLPAGWDAGSLRVFFSAAGEITLGNRTLHNGDSAAVIPGEKISLSAGKKGGYTLNVVQSANIPAVFVTTESGNIKALKESKDNREAGQCAIVNADGSIEYNGALEYIRIRGNASLYYSKKAFQIKLDRKAGLFGMNADKKWILLANYLDKSLLRNTIAYAVARYSGAYSFVPGTQPVDLFLNHQYYGSFLLAEKCEIDRNRLDIPDLEKALEKANDAPLESYRTFGEQLYALGARKGYRIPNDPEDITGGYLILANSRSYYAGEASGFVTRRGQAFTLDQPKYASEQQTVYTQGVFQAIEDALWDPDGNHPETGKHWTEMLDEKSFVNRYLLAEVLADFDGQKPYFYKSTDSKDPMVYCAPVWDQDNILGANQNMNQPARFYICNQANPAYLWFPKAMELEDFSSAVRQYYRNVYAPALRILLGEETDPDGKLLSLDQYAAEIAASAAMDNIRWPISANRATNFNPRTGNDPETNVQYLRRYIEKRMNFLNGQWGN